MMAAADGTVDEDERDALEDIAEHLGLREDAVTTARMDHQRLQVDERGLRTP